jgi:hypothetical protein
MKSRLGQAPLAPVKLAFTSQQAFTEHTLCTLQRQPFHKGLVVGYQNVFDQVRMIEKESFLRAQPEVGNVTVLFREFLKKRQRPAPVSQQPREGNPLPRTGRKTRTVFVLLLN